MKKFPRDAHKLPYMDGNYLTFPDWCWRSDLATRICAWIGDTFFEGRYCFTVDRNRVDADVFDEFEGVRINPHINSEVGKEEWSIS